MAAVLLHGDDERARFRAQVDLGQRAADGPVARCQLMGRDRRFADRAWQCVERLARRAHGRMPVDSRRKLSSSTSITLPGTSIRAKACARTSSDASSSSATATVAPELLQRLRFETIARPHDDGTSGSSRGSRSAARIDAYGSLRTATTARARATPAPRSASSFVASPKKIDSPCGAHLADGRAVHVEDHVRHAKLAQRAAEQPSADAEAEDDDVIRHARRAGSSGDPFAGTLGLLGDPGPEPRRNGDEQPASRPSSRCWRRAESATARGEQPGIDARAAEDERELADLREADAGGYRDAERRGDRPQRSAATTALTTTSTSVTASTSGSCASNRVEIGEHAERDEEQPGEDVAQRTDLGVRLMAEFALGEDQPAEKRAERHRNAEQRADPRRADAGQEHGERKRFAASALRHQPEEDGQDQPADERYRADRRGRAQQHERHAAQRRLARQDRHEQQQTDDREVLKEQDADHQAAMRCIELVA